MPSDVRPIAAAAPTQFMDPILQAQLKAQEIAMNLGLGGGAGMPQPMAPVAVPPAPSSAASLAGAALQAQVCGIGTIMTTLTWTHM